MKKGFTLVELLAVLAILATIIVIAGTSYSSVNKKNKTKQCENLKKQIENLAIEYVNEQNYFHDVSSLDKSCVGNPTKCGAEINKREDYINENGDYVYQEKKYKANVLEQNYTPTVLVSLKNIINNNYIELNEDGELENPYNGKVIESEETFVEVVLDEGNNLSATLKYVQTKMNLAEVKCEG